MNYKYLAISTTAFVITVLTASFVYTPSQPNTTFTVPTTTTSYSGTTNLAGDAKKTITMINPSSNQIVELNGEVNQMSAAQVIGELNQKAQLKKPLYLVINSPGGSVLDGFMIISAMEALKVPVYTVCTELCASMAAMIHQYGTERLMVDRAILMFHPASSGGGGAELDKLVSRLEAIQRMIGKVEATIAKRAGISLLEYKTLANYELWIDAEDSVNRHFADKIVSMNLEQKTIPPILPNNQFNIRDLVKW